MQQPPATRIIFTGDAYLNQPFTIGPELESLLNQHDVRLFNLEGALTADAPPALKAGKHLPLNQDAITQAGKWFNFCSLANNHAYDYGENGLVATINHCRASGIVPVGAGPDHSSALRGFDLGQILLIAAAEHEFGAAANGIAGIAAPDQVELVAKVRQAARSGKKVVVFYHGGSEILPVPSPYLRNLFRQLILAGAEAVINSHPHVVQGYELFANKLICYSLGNLFFNDQIFDQYPDCAFSLAVSLDIKTNKAEVIPLYVIDNQVNICPLASARTRLEELGTLLQDQNYPTTYRQQAQQVFGNWYQELAPNSPQQAARYLHWFRCPAHANLISEALAEYINEPIRYQNVEAPASGARPTGPTPEQKALELVSRWEAGGKKETPTLLAQLANLAWFTPTEQDYLNQVAISAQTCLQIGGGVSTIILAQLVTRLVVAESDKKMVQHLQQFKDRLQLNNLEIHYLPPEPSAFYEDGTPKWISRRETGAADFGKQEEFTGYLNGIEKLLLREKFDMLLLAGLVRQPVVQLLLNNHFDGILLLTDANNPLCTPIQQTPGVIVSRVNGSLAELCLPPYRLEVGSTRQVPGWINTNVYTEQHPLDITNPSHWDRFPLKSIGLIMGEHVLEHLTPNQVQQFFSLAYPRLAPGGKIRMAVPDALHASEYCRQLTKPGGLDVGSDDHKIHFSVKNISNFFNPEQYQLRTLEWWDEDGFHRRDWDNTPLQGQVKRSSRLYQGRFTDNEDEHKKLVLTTPAHLRRFYTELNITFTSFIFELTKPQAASRTTVTPAQGKPQQPKAPVNLAIPGELQKITGFAASLHKVNYDFKFRQHFPWLRFEQIRLGDWYITLWGHGDFTPFIHENKLIIGYSRQDLELLGSERVKNRGVFIRVENNRIYLENDTIGSFRVFYGQADDKTCIASWEEAVLQAIGRQDPDQTNLLQYLLAGYCTGRQTIYPHVFTMEANTLLRFNGRFETKRQPAIKPRQCYDPEEALYNATNRVVNAYTGGYQRLLLPLSGGLDSRLLAAFCEQPNKLVARTYGYSYPLENSFEVALASRTAKALNITDWEAVDLGSDFVTGLAAKWFDIFGTSHHLHGMYVLSFFDKLAQADLKQLPVLSGFIGDAIVGRQLSSYVKVASSNPVTKYRSALYSGLYKFDENELNNLLSTNPSQHLPAITRRWEQNWLQTEGQDYLRYMLTICREKGRSHVSYLCTIADLYGTAITPYTDLDYLETVLGLPFEALYNRKAQQMMLANRLPNLDFGTDITAGLDYSNLIESMDINKNKRRAAWPVPDTTLEHNRQFFNQDGLNNLLADYDRLCNQINDAPNNKAAYQMRLLQPLLWPPTVAAPQAAPNADTTVYNNDYFNWQKNIGAFGGVANLFKFMPFVNSGMAVLDFGCGGGYLLHNLPASQKYGIEPNPAAREEAQKHGLRVFADASYLPPECVDAIISNHALEHVTDPLSELTRLLPLLKTGGVAVFVVPHQTPAEQWNPDDINHHLYTWNQQTLGNLFAQAGFEVKQVEAIQHQWPPNYAQLWQELGEEEFHKKARQHAINNNNWQIRIVAVKRP